MKTGRKFTAEFKGKVALEAIKVQQVKRVRRQASASPYPDPAMEETVLADSRKRAISDEYFRLFLSHLTILKALFFVTVNNYVDGFSGTPFVTPLVYRLD